MKIAYAISSLFVLTVVGLVLLGSGTSFAGHDCPCFDPPLCGWWAQPTATDADEDGFFDTGTDGDSNEPTIDWCVTNHPIGGGVLFIKFESANIDEEEGVTYVPTTFSAHCSGTQEIRMMGKLKEPEDDGLLETRAAIGPAMCLADKSLAINAF